MAVSELCWLLPDPPDECLQYFAAEYPAMADVGENLSTIEDCGYRVVGHFTLPESSWWEPYYDPLQERLQLVRQAHLAEADKIAMIDSVQTEIDLFRRYSRFYGYVFYILKR